MKEILNNPQVRMFLKGYGLFLFLGLTLVLVTEKHVLHQWVNQFHSPFFDSFFKYLTHLGDGVLFVILFFIALIFNRKVALQWVFVGIVVLLVSGFFKQVVFPGVLRPTGAIQEGLLHLIEGVKMHKSNSFPSGHTTAAFAIAFTFLFQSKKAPFFWLFSAILVGFSRVYLSQHFIEDVLFGSLLGVTSAIFGCFLDSKVKLPKKWLSKN